MSKELDKVERGELTRCELIISKGASTFVEVGMALAAIKDGKWYRDSHKTFEAYCGDKWQMGIRFAQLTIKSSDAARRIENAHNCAQVLPKLPNGSAARELAKLPDDQQAKAYEKAVEKSDGKAPTAKVIKEVVREMLPEPETEKPVTKPPKGELKANVKAAIDGAAGFKAIIRDLQACGREIEKLAEKPHGGGINRQACGADLNNVWRHLRFATPHAPCPYCGQKGCRACKKLGWVTLSAWNNAPKDLQKGHASE